MNFKIITDVKLVNYINSDHYVDYVDITLTTHTHSHIHYLASNLTEEMSLRMRGDTGLFASDQQMGVVQEGVEEPPSGKLRLQIY